MALIDELRIRDRTIESLRLKMIDNEFNFGKAISRNGLLEIQYKHVLRLAVNLEKENAGLRHDIAEQHIKAIEIEEHNPSPFDKLMTDFSHLERRIYILEGGNEIDI